MNILMIHPHDLFYSGEPWTRRIICIAEKLGKRGHSVRVVYFPAKTRNPGVPFQKENIEYIPFVRKMTPFQLIRSIRRLRALARQVDIIHLQKCHHYAALPALIASYTTGTPLHYDWDDWEEKIWIESCGRSWHSLFVAVSFSILERALPFLADSVTCASAHLKRLALRRGASGQSLKESPVGVDKTVFFDAPEQSIRMRYGLKPEDKIVLYVGQLHGAQYVDLVIKAANRVYHKMRCSHRIKFIVVGDGYLKKSLVDMVEDLGLSDDFIFSGSIPPEEVPLYMRSADICVAPFKNTKVTICKSPLKIVEYMACGKYIVASAVGEVVEMLGGCGYLAPEGSPEGIAEGILYFLDHCNDEALRKKITERLAQRVAYKYTWDYTVDNLLSLYKQACG